MIGSQTAFLCSPRFINKKLAQQLAARVALLALQVEYAPAGVTGIEAGGVVGNEAFVLYAWLLLCI